MAVLCVCISTSSKAATINGSTSDFEARLSSTGLYDPGNSTTATSLRSGFQANFVGLSPVFFFQLPTLAGGQSINNASVSFSLLPDSAVTAVTPAHNADLVALGFTNVDPPAKTQTEGQSYYYIGQGDTAPGHVLIQDNFLAPTDFIPNGGTATRKSTDAIGSAALSTYISGLYADPSFVPGTSYLILRVNPDLTGDTGTKRYTLGSARNANASFRPTLDLDITPVPEPSTMALVGIGLGALGFGRLKRVRR
jgi:hypothetical protein